VRKKVVEVCSPTKDSKILDVCTGTGGQAIEFGKKGFEVTGIDLSEEMLEVAKKKNKHENVKFEIGDAANIPLKDIDFNISCVSFGLHEMPHTIIEKVLSEIKRVTKPDGKIIIVDYSLPKNKLIRSVGYHFIKIYESKYFQSFVKTDLPKLLKTHEIDVTQNFTMFLGFVTIYECKKK